MLESLCKYPIHHFSGLSTETSKSEQKFGGEIDRREERREKGGGQSKSFLVFYIIPKSMRAL